MHIQNQGNKYDSFSKRVSSGTSLQASEGELCEHLLAREKKCIVFAPFYEV